MAATALADGSGGGALGVPAFSNEVEGALVRAITGPARARPEAGDARGRQDARAQSQLSPRPPDQGRPAHGARGQPVAFASSAATAASVAPLQDEARVRMKRYLDAPPVDYLPAPLLQLAPNQSHALLIDTSRSRLFVYANDLGRPRYVTDFYISLGKNGVDKPREGDQKTPIGVYTILALKDKLPDFYGPGAYPLSYPNEWDRLNGRNGHGIWLHGTPSDTYSRAPWATDGCVVLTNEDLARLSKYVDVSRTPVVIGQAVEWRAPGQWEAEREAFLAAFGKWKTDWESLDANRYLSHYSRNFRSERRDFAAWSARKRQVNSGKTWIKVGVNDMSVFAYPGTRDLMMITFEQDYRSNNLSNRTMKRQFWAARAASGASSTRRSSLPDFLHSRPNGNSHAHPIPPHAHRIPRHRLGPAARRVRPGPTRRLPRERKRTDESETHDLHGPHRHPARQGQGAHLHGELREVRRGGPLQRHHLPPRDRRLHGPGRRLHEGHAPEAREPADQERVDQRPEERQLHRGHGAHQRARFGDRRSSSST